MRSMAVRNDEVKMRKIIKIVMIMIMVISIGVFFSIALVQFFDGPVAYVPVGKVQPVAVQVVNENKTDYVILIPGDKGYEDALKKATHIKVSPDYEPPAKKKNLRY